jgi:hypothetical protein
MNKKNIFDKFDTANQQTPSNPFDIFDGPTQQQGQSSGGMFDDLIPNQAPQAPRNAPQAPPDAFDPDAFIASQGQQQFDPDAFIASQGQQFDPDRFIASQGQAQVPANATGSASIGTVTDQQGNAISLPGQQQSSHGMFDDLIPAQNQKSGVLSFDELIPPQGQAPQAPGNVAQASPDAFASPAAYGAQLGGEPQLSPEQLAVIQQNLVGAAGDLARGVPGFVESLPGMAYQGAKFAVGGPQEKTQVGLEALKQAIPQGFQEAKDIQSPVGSREWLRGVAQALMLASPAAEGFRPEIRPEIKPEVKPEINAEAPPTRPEAPVARSVDEAAVSEPPPVAPTANPFDTFDQTAAPQDVPGGEGEILYGAPDEIAQAEGEMHAQALADYHEHMTRGGDEFLDALDKAGGLPAISSPKQKFSGELQNIREAYRSPRKERIAYNKIFKTNAPDPDVVAQRMRAAGFDVATDTDLLAMAEERVRTGRPIYGMEERGAGVLAEPGGSYNRSPSDSLPVKALGESAKPSRTTAVGQLLHGFEHPIQSIDEVRADLERLGITQEEREILSRKHWVAAEPVDGAINEIFGTRQDGADYMRTMSSPGEVLIERQTGKPDRIVHRQPETLRIKQEREIERMRQYFGKSDLTSADMDQYLKEHGRKPSLRGQAREVSPGSEAAPETSALPRESQAEENAFAQQFFDKNYAELSPDELRTLHNARLHEEPPQLTAAEQTVLEKLRRAGNSLTAAGRRKLAALEAKSANARELFKPEETPFNLRGEGLTEELGTEGQARARAQAEYEQKKAQPGLFGRAGIERAKEGGGVPRPYPNTATRPAGAPFGAVKGSGRYRRTYQVNKEAGDKINALAASRESAELRAEFQTRNLLGGLSKSERAMLGRYLVSERLKTVNPEHPQILSDQTSASITRNPRIVQALQRYVQNVKPDIESLRKKAGLSESAAAGKRPEFISLIPTTKEQLPTKPGELPFKLKSKTTRFAKPASGMAAKYEMDPGKLLRASYTEVMQKARLRDFYQSLKNNGLVSTTPVTEIKGQPVQAVPFGRARKGANGVALPEVSWMPRAIANDLKDVMERPAESSGAAIKLAKAAQRGVTGAALTANPAELINHMRRQLDVVAAMPAANARFTARAVEAMVPYFGPRLGTFTRVLLDDMSRPANQAILQDIFDAGAGSARAFEEFQAKIPVLKQIQGATQKLLFGIPKGRGVGGWDLRMRVQLEKIRRAVEGNTDPQRIREFANQIGQYTKKPDWLIEAVKKVNPYAATTLPMRVTELKQAVGTSGLKYRGIGQSIAGRGETLLRGVGGTLLALATTNYLLSGRWPWENDKGHEFDLNTGVRDRDGKRVYVKLRALAPTLSRPVNTLSLPELARESGARKPQYGAAATIGPFNQVASLLSGGPLGNAAITAGTGYAPYLTRIPGRETNFLDLARGQKGQAGIMNDRAVRAAMAAVQGINPIGGAFKSDAYRVQVPPLRYIERPLPGIEPFGKVFTKSYEQRNK